MKKTLPTLPTLPIPIWQPPEANHTLWLGIGVSIALHGLLLAINFTFPEASRAFRDNALEIILVNSKSARAPTAPQALAQTNLDGGGDTDQDRRAKTALPASREERAGDDIEQAQKQIQELESRQQQLMTRARSKPIPAPTKTDKAAEAPATPTPAPISGHDLANSALAMARLEAEIARETDAYNKRPRLKTVGTRASYYPQATFLDGWKRKVERIGTLNYPSAAKGKLYGSVTIWVVLKKEDGSLYQDVEIRQSSGSQILDRAAKRIVTMGSPYGEIPQGPNERFDNFGFARTLTFTRGNQLESKEAK